MFGGIRKIQRIGWLFTSRSVYLVLKKTKYVYLYIFLYKPFFGIFSNWLTQTVVFCKYANLLALSSLSIRR